MFAECGGDTLSHRLNILFTVGILILQLAIVGCGKLHLQSVTIGNPHDTYNKPEPPPSNFTVYDVDTGDTLSCTRIGGTVTCTK
jgi:hypothetical protein